MAEIQGPRGTYELRDYEGFLFPYTKDTTILGAPVEIPDWGITLKNSISTHPMEGGDCEEDGTPTEYTMYRGELLAKSGAGLIWTEAMAVQEDGKGNSHTQWITKDNVDGYKRLVEHMRSVDDETVIISQLTHSGRFSKPHNKQEPITAVFNPHYMSVPTTEDTPIVSDDYLDRAMENFVEAARLCKEAGYDGVDVKACHGYLTTDLLCAYNRPGKYGGSLENRMRFLLETFDRIHDVCGPDFKTACRLCFSESIVYPYGYGTKKDGTLEYDYTEAIQIIKALYEHGVRLVDLSVGMVNMNPAYTNGMYTEKPIESPIKYFSHFYDGTKAIHEACPEMIIIGSDYSAVKGDVGYVAAGAFAEDAVSMVGFGRNSIAYPGFAHALLNGEYDPTKCCTACGQCFTLLHWFVPCGCGIRDPKYIPLLKECHEKEKALKK